MKASIRSAALVLCLALAAAPALAPASPGEGAHAHPEDNSVNGLPATAHNVEQVGSVHLTDRDDGIGDVAALGNFAYVAAYAAECYKTSATSPGGGVHVVDFTVPQAPVKVGFISAGPNNYVGEGVHAMRLKTSKFQGDVLLTSNEPCSSTKKAYGGISLFDVTDPRNPVTLVRGFGDRTPKPANLTAHSSHSAMMWQAGKKAYAVLQDNHESGSRDVDILDITNPRKPKLIAETGLASWPGAQTQTKLGTFPGSFHHDMMVKKIDGHWYMVVSNWDAGFVLLDIDNPARPRFIRDSDYPRVDPLTKRKPEGNGHQASWSADGKYMLGADEDFFAKFTLFAAGDRPMRVYEWAHGKMIRTTYGMLNGPTVYGGAGCPLLSAVPPSSRAGRLSGGEEATLVVLEGGGCSYADKVRAAETAGYEAIIIVASHQTTGFGEAPYRVSCDEQNGGATARISVICMSHVDFHTMFDTVAQFGISGDSGPEVGERGSEIRARGLWDGGWGALHLLDGRTLKQIDAYAIPESLKERYGEVAGPLSIHETKTDPRKGVNLAYASWYSGGLRVLKFGKGGIKEVGRYIAEGGNNFWGVYPIFQRVADEPVGEPLLLMSDMNHGLYILRYTGPK